jgi:hypothetical protein
VCILLFFWKISSQLMAVVIYSFIWGSKFCCHVAKCVQPVQYVLIFEHFWMKVRLRVLFNISSIGGNFASSFWNLFHLYRTFHNRDIENPSHLLSCPKNAIVSDFSGDIRSKICCYILQCKYSYL